ncbi:pancreatic lipase-related protein 2-like [Mixophyes fleayi]|uniref:pancreatic lipase-related protein 2-like n=1 Tax=Mixophyes fleayi TaxID=3061075 RepID=UPI003F4DFBF9
MTPDVRERLNLLGSNERSVTVPQFVGVMSVIYAYYTLTSVDEQMPSGCCQLQLRTLPLTGVTESDHLYLGASYKIQMWNQLQGEVCYDRLGCFTNKAPWSATLQRPISFLPWTPEHINTRFLLYTRESNNYFQEVSATELDTISASHFQTTRKSRFIIHGFAGSGERTWLADMCQAMLQVEDVNCFCVDWKGGSQTLYTQATNNVRVVGAEVAYFINTLLEKFDYPLSNLHLIGHSLGAHVAGEAGKRRPGIARITGLDPAQPYFQDTPAEVRLDPSDALFVDAIHTDGSSTIANLGYGMSHSVGHLDFYPNGGEQMPGCQKTQVLAHGNIDEIMDVPGDLAACNHLRSYKYYTESILIHDGFIGYPATSYRAFLGGAGFPCPSGCPLMGHYADMYSGVTSTSQTFYLNTGDVPTFSRWRYKVTVQTAGTGNVLGSFAISLQGSNQKTLDHKIKKGIIKTDRSYTEFMDAEIFVGDIEQVTFVWHSDIPNIFHRKLGASAITVQYGKDGSMYSFCDRTTVADNIHQFLSPCSSH